MYQVYGSTIVDISGDKLAATMVKYNWTNQAAGYRSITLMEQDEIAALGASLRKIDQKLLTPAKEEGVIRVWYQGGEAYFDVFVDLRQGKVEWFQFTLRGRSISWNPQTSAWQTGTTNELRTDDVSFYAASKLIESHQQPDPQFIELVRSILRTRAGEDIFDQMLVLLETKE